MKKIPVEVYSRVVGYFRPIQAWNKGKREEFSDRTPMPVAKLRTVLKDAECGYTDDTRTA